MSVQKAATRGPDNTPIGLVEEDASVEEVFGLGNEQLRELMEQELPVPREDLVTGTTQDENEKDPNKVFNLPDLDEYMRGDGGVRKSGGATQVKNRFEEQREAMTEKKVDRSDAAEYSRVLELNPFADADESMFTKEYDSFQGIFGEGKLLRIPIPYLQTGHGILLVIILIAAFVEAPGNPLTEWPGEYRQFFQEGLMYTFSINLVLSIQAFLVARKKNLPSAFWAVKCLLLGGVAFYEVQEATDPLAAPDPFGGNDPSDRKSRR
jgi:hypothetical protein